MYVLDGIMLCYEGVVCDASKSVCRMRCMMCYTVMLNVTCSHHTGPSQSIFKKYLHELVGMALKSQNHDFLVEVLAVLANIVLPDGETHVMACAAVRLDECHVDHVMCFSSRPTA